MMFRALRIVSMIWNGLALLAAIGALLMNIRSVGLINEMLGIEKPFQFIPAELALSVLIASMMEWLIIMIVWAVGALTLGFAKYLSRPSPHTIRMRREPRLR